LSYSFPVLLERAGNGVNDYVELYLSRNRLQLATYDALYSDDDKYVPALVAVNTIKKELPKIKRVLSLGAGLGSIVSVLRSNGSRPETWLVDTNATTLGWAREYLMTDQQAIHFECIDAQEFIQQTQQYFDLVFVDIFIGKTVPGFVTEKCFWEQCKRLLNPEGVLAFNFIESKAIPLADVNANFSAVFKKYTVERIGINAIFVTRL